MPLTLLPSVLLHGLDDDNEEEGEEVEALAHVRARHLEQVVLVELLEHAPLQLDKLQQTGESVGHRPFEIFLPPLPQNKLDEVLAPSPFNGGK